MFHTEKAAGKPRDVAWVRVKLWTLTVDFYMLIEHTTEYHKFSRYMRNHLTISSESLKAFNSNTGGAIL